MLRREGQPLPPEATPPKETTWQAFYVAAFWDLNTERPNNGWSIGPIPESKIHDYMRRKGLRVTMAEAATFVIRQMDVAWLKWQRAEHEKKYPPKT